MKFLFDCEDEVLLPRAYALAEEAGKFFEKMREVAADGVEGKDAKQLGKLIFEKMLTAFPAETSALLSKMWVLDEGEKAPNALKTLNLFIRSEDALDFFTGALPMLVSFAGKS